MRSGRLAARVAVITGAGSGIGRASALLFAREGAYVVVADLVEATALETAALIGPAATALAADVTVPADLERLVAATLARHGRLDILFNNAGIDLPRATNVVSTSEADWQRIVDVNLKGVLLGARAALPVMKAQGRGAIVNTASQAGLVGTPQEAAYCASKGGVVALTRQMAVDYAPFNIRVNCVCPGAVDRPTVDRAGWLAATPDGLAQRQARLAAAIPLGRLCTAMDVAYAALYLASDEAAYVTGTALVVDGGVLAL